jgi:nicotinamidase-related amidase
MAKNFEDHCWQDIVNQDIFRIYESYARETYIGPKPALLVIDLYNKAYRGGSRPVVELLDKFPSACGEHAWNAIEPTQKLLALSRGNSVPVIYTTQVERQASAVRATSRVIDAHHDNDFDIFPEFQVLEDDLLIEKERASAFFGTPLIAYLQQMKIDTVIVCGESTSGCVRASAVDAYSYGFHVVMAEEACFDRSMLSHKVNLFDLHHKYADVMHIEEITEHFQSKLS